MTASLTHMRAEIDEAGEVVAPGGEEVGGQRRFARRATVSAAWEESSETLDLRGKDRKRIAGRMVPYYNPVTILRQPEIGGKRHRCKTLIASALYLTFRLTGR